MKRSLGQTCATHAACMTQESASFPRLPRVYFWVQHVLMMFNARLMSLKIVGVCEVLRTMSSMWEVLSVFTVPAAPATTSSTVTQREMLH